MTVSSDILLNGTAVAPKAANRNAVSSDKGQQAGDITSIKSDTNSFKDHLAQEAKQEAKQETKQTKSSPKTTPSPQQPAEATSPMIPKEVISKDKPVQNLMSTTTEDAIIAKAMGIENNGNDEDSQGEESSNHANNITVVKENPTQVIEDPTQKHISQKDAGLIRLAPVTVPNTEDNNALVREDIKTPESDGAFPPLTIRAFSPLTIKGDQVSPNEPIIDEANPAQSVITKTTAQEVPVARPQQIEASKDQRNSDSSPVINNLSASQAVLTTEEAVLTQPPLVLDTTTQAATVPTTEQAALASLQQVSMNDPANEKHLKDSTKESIKETTGKDNGVTASEGKNTSAAGKKEQGSSQDSASDQNSNKAIAELIQNASPKGSNQVNLLSKLPFVADLSQNLIVSEGKTSQGGGLLLPSGLLSVQEIAQVGQHANSLNATTNHIKHPMPPVTPQMLTKQISLSILKQAQNGQDSFRINLKPAELGQVDIRMDFHTDGKMTATVSVESDRTLALLQRDQGALQKALENAGFDAGGNNLNFSLKKQQQDHTQSNFLDNNTEDGDYDDISAAPNSINSHQQMKMAYSDNALDINI